MDLVEIAGVHSAGLTNDHIEIMVTSKPKDNLLSSAYLRRNFNASMGPKPYPDRGAGRYEVQYCSDKDQTQRCWQDTSTISHDVPYDDAVQQATELAKQQGVVLYESRDGKTIIKWKPEGWKPKKEGPPDTADHLMIILKTADGQLEP